MEQPDAIEVGKEPGEAVLIFEPKPGRPRRIDAYNTVRAGISWPGPETPGYYCIFGLKRAPVASGRKQLVLLEEDERQPLEAFFERYAIRTRKYLCSMALANLEDNPGFDAFLKRFRNERKMEALMPYDSSEFEDFRFGVSLANQWMREGALIIPKEGILGRQVGTMLPEDIRGANSEQFYAVLALFRVLGSFEYYPWSKPSRKFVGFSNIADRQRAIGTKSYQTFSDE